jgi:hypothetical protein
MRKEIDKASLKMNRAQYAQHRGKSRQYIYKLANAGILVMRGKLVDVAASDAVLDDKPVDGEEDGDDQTAAFEATVSIPAAADQVPPRHTADGGPSYAQARMVDMTFRAKLRRLEFEKQQGRLIDAEAVRKLIADANRMLRDGLLGIAGRVAPVFAAETDGKKIESLLLQEIKRELTRQADAIDAI